MEVCCGHGGQETSFLKALNNGAHGFWDFLCWEYLFCVKEEEEEGRVKRDKTQNKNGVEMLCSQLYHRLFLFVVVGCLIGAKMVFVGPNVGSIIYSLILCGSPCGCSLEM